VVVVAAAVVVDSVAVARQSGPFVLPGTYSVALVVDGKTVETKPLRVMATQRSC
jgi:hypothetical protein